MHRDSRVSAYVLSEIPTWVFEWQSTWIRSYALNRSAGLTTALLVELGESQTRNLCFFYSVCKPYFSMLNKKILFTVFSGVQSKIGYFLGLSTSDSSGHQDETFLNQLGIASDVVFIVSILYSFIMIITALVSPSSRPLTHHDNLSLGKSILYTFIMIITALVRTSSTHLQPFTVGIWKTDHVSVV